jgi:hypothetical protein
MIDLSIHPGFVKLEISNTAVRKSICSSFGVFTAKLVYYGYLYALLELHGLKFR